jgi:2-polyprenyl-6-methoxyphenol hydroxylase-like FAD-dependent oxidoreductase
MPCVTQALIVGAGPAGLSAAIALRQRGVNVHVVDRAPGRNVPGSELSIGGAFVRALDSLGLAEACAAVGIEIPTTFMHAADGSVISEIPMPPIARAELPVSVGITRNNLRGVLETAADSAGAEFRYGTTVDSIANDDETVHVELSDGTTGSYDLVVGADGVRSRVRSLCFPDAPELRYTGQGVWRARVTTHGAATLSVFFGPRNKAGLVSVSEGEDYLFCVVNAPEHLRPAKEEFPQLLRDTLAAYGGAIAQSREELSDPADIHYSGLYNLIVPDPWFAGRVLLIGDAAHACTPHLAYGAGIAVEDGVVLGEVVDRNDDLPSALVEFMSRRFDRCCMVVKNSEQLGVWEQEPENLANGLAAAELTGSSWMQLSQPI